MMIFSSDDIDMFCENLKGLLIKNDHIITKKDVTDALVTLALLCMQSGLEDINYGNEVPSDA